MFWKLTVIGALVLGFAAQAMAAQIAAPVSEALVDRFMAALPDADRLGSVDRTANPEELARLTELNGGRAEEIRPILETFQACDSAASNAYVQNRLRDVARQLDPQMLERLIQFYQSDDRRTFDALMARRSSGERLTDPEEAERERIVTLYPLREFEDALRAAQGNAWDGASLEPTFDCMRVMHDSLMERGLRLF